MGPHRKVKSEESLISARIFFLRKLNWIADDIISELFMGKTLKMLICIKPQQPSFGNIKYTGTHVRVTLILLLAYTKVYSAFKFNRRV